MSLHSTAKRKRKNEFSEDVRVYEIARCLDILSEDVIDCMRELGYNAKSHSSRVDAATANCITAFIAKKKKHGWSGTKSADSSHKKKEGGSDDSGTWQSSPVPKKPYPGNDNTAVSLALPTDKSKDDDA